MNLKYYLRGLGIGIFVTALIMGVAVKSHPQTMTESEIRAEAEKLGMVDGRSVLQETTEQNVEKEVEVEVVENNDEDVESVSVNSVVSDNTSEVDDSVTDDESKSDGTQNPDENQNLETENDDELKNEDSEDAGQKSEDSTVDQTEDTQDALNTESSRKTVTITIYSGDGSQTVSKRLKEAGIVEDAREYDRYLCENGYERRLRVGNFEIPVDASDEEIAKIITGR